MDNPPPNQSAAEHLPRAQFVEQASIRHYGAAALGSVFIGTVLPFVLVCLRLSNKSLGRICQITDIPPGLELLCIAVILCGPGAIVLSLVLFKLIMRETQSRNWSQALTFGMGALLGIVFASINLPAYLVSDVLRGDTHVTERVILLFIVAGSSCGMWVAWQAWRAAHPEEKFLPRFSLRTLVLLVMLWGCAMLAFQPRDWPQPKKTTYGER